MGSSSATPSAGRQTPARPANTPSSAPWRRRQVTTGERASPRYTTYAAAISSRETMCGCEVVDSQRAMGEATQKAAPSTAARAPPRRWAASTNSAPVPAAARVYSVSPRPEMIPAARNTRLPGKSRDATQPAWVCRYSRAQASVGWGAGTQRCPDARMRAPKSSICSSSVRGRSSRTTERSVAYRAKRRAVSASSAAQRVRRSVPRTRAASERSARSPHGPVATASSTKAGTISSAWLSQKEASWAATSARP